MVVDPLRVLNLGGGNVDTGTPMGLIFPDSQIANARRLIEQGQPASHVARDLGMSRATLSRRIAHLDAQQRVSTRAGHTDD